MTPEQRRDIVHATLVECLPAYGFPYLSAIVPLAQAAHETGGFASPIAVQFNNVYGMKVPLQRPFNGHGSGVWEAGWEFAAYDSVEESVEDYLERQRYFHIDTSGDPDKYIKETIQSGYATDPNYENAWRSWINQLGGVEFSDPFADGDPIEDPGPTGGIQAAYIPFGPILILIALVIAASQSNTFVRR